MIQDKLDKLLPHLRAFAYEETTMNSRFTVMFPAEWNYATLQSLILMVISSTATSNLLMLGVTEDDKPIDYFFDEIEKVIIFNKENEKKRELLNLKIAELTNKFNQSSLAEVEKITISEIIPSSIQEVNNEVFWNYQVLEREPDENIGNSQLIDFDDINVPNIVQQMAKEKKSEGESPNL